MSTVGACLGGGRFLLERKLGEGSFGAVFLALDRERGGRLALKELTRMEPQALYRFKEEFRSLAGLLHPNLVALYELFGEEGSWYFTMELVEGVDFLHAHRRGPRSARPTSAVSDAEPQTPDLDAEVDAVRLRDGLRQLALGLNALHAAGTLHRDLKPSNVLVAEDGRVVLLDFGLAVPLDDEQLVVESAQGKIVGTPHYMSPEQAAGRPLGPASDWYAVGAMLYESLTGRPPLTGTALGLIVRKQTERPADPREGIAGLPDDLCDLAMRLLSIDPAQRPDGEALLAALGQSKARRPARVERGDPVFVGRERELSALEEAYDRSRAGRAQVVVLKGASGLGKSALVERFLSRHADALVLSGRCYERERIVYKGFDAVVDALVHHLVRLPITEEARLVPRDAPSLVKIFPTMARSAMVAEARGRPVEGVDPHEVRRRGAAALREMLARLRERGPLIVWIDDVQWGDADAAGLAVELLLPPQAPPILLGLSTRSEDEAESVVLRALRQARATPGMLDAQWRELELRPLGDTDARTLAQRLLGPQADEAVLSAIARESGGSPLFAGALAAHAKGGGGIEGTPMERLLLEAAAGLPDGAQRLLLHVALAGADCEEGLLGACTGLLGGDLQQALSALSAQRLVRWTAEGGVDTYHDRIREVLTRATDAGEARRVHERLAVALEAGGGDAEALSRHFHAAGRPAPALRYARQAAEEARAALAFERSAAMYAVALSLDQARPPELLEAYAEALALAGLGLQAAETFLELAASTSGPQALRRRIQAAEQYMRAGYPHEGLAAAQPAMRALGVSLPRGTASAVARVLWHRVMFKLRGLGVKVRDEASIAPERLLRVDLLRALAIGFSYLEPLLGMVFSLEGCREALATGEPERASWALGHVAWLIAYEDLEDVTPFVEASRALSDTGMAGAGDIGAAFSQGRYLELVSIADRFSERFHARPGAQYEATSGEFLACASLMHTGRVRELVTRLPRQIAEARRRSDRFAQALQSVVLAPYVRLTRGEPELARRESRAAGALVSDAGPTWNMFRYFELWVEVLSLLYQGENDRAWQALLRAWSRQSSSPLMRSPTVRWWALHLAGAAAAGVGDERMARKVARKLLRERRPAGRALGSLIAACIEPSGPRFGEASAHLEAAELELFAAAALRRQGELTGGEPGRALIERADQTMRAQQVAEPMRFAAMLAPLPPRLGSPAA